VLAVFGLLAALPGMGQADIGIPFRPPVEHFTGQVFDLAWNGHALEGVFIGDRAQEKPLIIFVPGSEPVPLFCAMGNAFQPLFPHQLLAHGSEFNFLLLSKPGIPAVQARERLDENFYFVEDPGGGPPDAYLSHNTLEFCTAKVGRRTLTCRTTPWNSARPRTPPCWTAWVKYAGLPP